MRKGKKAKTDFSRPASQARRNHQAKSSGAPRFSGRRRTGRPAPPERAIRHGLGIVGIGSIPVIKDRETVSLAFGKDQVHGSLIRAHRYLTHITRVMRNVCPSKSDIQIPESTNAVEVVRQINAVIRGAEDKLMADQGIGLSYDSERARWEFMVRDPQFDGLCRIFECSFLEHLRIADLHLYDIMVATLSHVRKKIRIPTWDDLLGPVMEMLENDAEWETSDDDEQVELTGKVNAATDYFRTGPPSRCLRAVHNAHNRLPWNKLRRVVEAYNWNTPQKQKILEWYRAAEKLCRTVKHDFIHYSEVAMSDDHTEYVPTHEIYGMYWSDNGTVDYQFNEYMNNQLRNFEPVPMIYRLNAEVPLKGIRPQDGEVRMIDDWMVQSCHLMDYRFMQTYFHGQRNFKRWVKEVYNPIVSKPKSGLLVDTLLEEVNVY